MSATTAWAESGAMALTGRAGGPALGPPPMLVSRLRSLGVTPDPLGILTDRAAIAGLRRNGLTSCGGATRLLRSLDGWIAVSLARPSDLELLPAWLGCDVPGDPWDGVEEAVRGLLGARARDDAVDLGLPVSVLGEVVDRAACHTTRLGEHDSTRSLEGITVVDFSSLWAGPLCGSLLANAGARVIKVESIERPDGARLGQPRFFDRLNAGKELRSVALHQFIDVLDEADVVIESSRPRAFAQLGIDAHEVARTGRPRVWLSITGYGRNENRVGFGDDAAVAGGLVVWEGPEPRFCADAVADPCSGMVAARAVLDALAAGGRWVLDIALARVAAWLAGPTLPVQSGLAASARTVRP